ncbi:MAG TPA: hypothetical protein PL155_02565 [Candidatus Omnitrophota bacterium]|nr:hypothetical protein [Candidatus Omnitrophota bacterium]HPD84631.1 hypothetical protein [Candidatus Omnitrophota bacterium]HRZ03489.1 hypothetical protein [Candidatus Omnitrophota bacterium]
MKNSKQHDAQVIIEFTFAFVVLLLIFYGCIMAFRWVGLSLSERQVAHETTLNMGINENWENEGEGPLRQLRTNFSKPTPLNLVFNKW